MPALSARSSPRATADPRQRLSLQKNDATPSIVQGGVANSAAADAHDQKRRVLVVEDEPAIADALRFNLAREGYDVLVAGNGRIGLHYARQHLPHAIVLDLMLPDLDGMEVCRILRAEMRTPILMLTARDSELDKVLGLELGADDYMTKPFSLRELLARLKALLRRAEVPAAAPSPSTDVQFGVARLSSDQHKVYCNDQEVHLSPKEYDVLALLVSNRGRVLTREMLLEKVWGYEYSGDTRTVDVHVHWLREKLETDPGAPRFIKTVRGVGYRFDSV